MTIIIKFTSSLLSVVNKRFELLASKKLCILSLPPGDYSVLTPPCTNDKPPPATMTFDLPLTHTHLGIYFGASGSSIKQLCKQHCVKIHLGPPGGDRRGPTGSLNGEKFEVTLTGDKKEHFSTVRQKMLQRAGLVTTKREKHEERVS